MKQRSKILSAHGSPHPSLSGSNLKEQCHLVRNNLLDWKLILRLLWKGCFVLLGCVKLQMSLALEQ